MNISPRTISAVFEQARIEEVIGKFLDLKKAGSNYKALSPFSDEKTPSFMVSPAKQIFKDYSSGIGGNVITFLKTHQGFTYPESIEFLAKQFNIPIDYENESLEQRISRKNLASAKEEAKEFYLQNSYIAQQYFDYKGFKPESRVNFEVGYAYGFERFEYKSLMNHLKGMGYPLETLVQANLIKLKRSVKDKLEDDGLSLASTNWNDYRDTFFERLIFPIKNHSGKIVGFAGRHLPVSTSKKDGDAPKENDKIPKYLNGDEDTPFGKTGYYKSNLLYGLDKVKSLIRKLDFAILSEGYTDVIAMQEQSLPAVGTSGTAFGDEQAKLLSRFTKNVINIFDGDEAGLRALISALAPQFKAGLSPKAIFLPEGEDPQSYLHSKELPAGFEGFKVYSALDAFIYAKKQLLNNREIDSDEKWEFFDDVFNNYFRWSNDKAKLLYNLTEFSKKLDIEPIVALDRYRDAIQHYRAKKSDELFYPRFEYTTAAQFICSLLVNSVHESSRVYVKNHLEETPINDILFQPYQLDIINLIQENFIYNRHELYVTGMQLDSPQTNIFESAITPIRLLQQWYSYGELSEEALEEISILKQPFPLKLETLSKLLHAEQRIYDIDALNYELSIALEKKDDFRINEITTTLENVYNHG